jgi:hypothetical protein
MWDSVHQIMFSWPKYKRPFLQVHILGREDKAVKSPIIRKINAEIQGDLPLVGDDLILSWP